MNAATQYGVVLGRFQPPHLGHMEYLEAAKRRCDRLVIGITNPDASSYKFHSADPKRSEPDNNPFTYFVRHEMIDETLRDSGWLPGTFAIVPADITDISRVGIFLPEIDHTTVFITVYDEWGDEKARRLASIGYRVEILWRRKMSERLTSGTELRRSLKSNTPWTHLVPPAVARYLNRAVTQGNAAIGTPKHPEHKLTSSAAQRRTTEGPDD